MRPVNSGPVYSLRDDSCFHLLRYVIPSGHARLRQRCARDWSGWDRFAVAGVGSGIIARIPDTSRAGGLPAQGATVHGIRAACFCGPALVRLVALVLGILDNIIVRGSGDRVFRPIGDHPGSA